jgi:hypothetical protein
LQGGTEYAVTMSFRRQNSPTRWLGEGSLPVCDCSGELAGSKVSLPDAFDKYRILSKLAAMKLVWIENADGKPNLLRDNSHRLGKIGVIGDENSNLEPLCVSVPQQVGRKIYI